MTKKIAAFTFAALTALGFASCNERKFHVEGAIENAADSVLYFENMGLNGVQTIDSVKLSADGAFAFDGKAVTAPRVLPTAYRRTNHKRSHRLYGDRNREGEISRNGFRL